tara:strand:+ start:548 stop:1192 length:645 start_codon:yes stop_codon:yes gene_type:complete
MKQLLILLNEAGPSLPLPQLIFLLIVFGLIVMSYWKIFEKAGKPGWASIIPVYNLVVLLQIVKKPVWWILLFFIPFVNLIIAFMVYHKLAQCFGKSVGFTFGLLFLPIIFLPLLAFSDATYNCGGNNNIQSTFNNIDAILNDIDSFMDEFEKNVNDFIDKGDTSAIQRYMEVSQKIMQKQIELQNIIDQLTEEQKNRYAGFEQRLEKINKKLEQ